VTGAGATLYQKAASKCVPLQPALEPKNRHWEIVVPTGRAPLTVKPTVKPAVDPDRSDMDELVQLADCGDWPAAAEQCRHMLTLDRLNPEVHFYQALIFENLLKVDEAERSLRQALYLDRNFALAHYHLGLALKRDGKMPASRRSFGNVRRALTGLPGDAELRAGRGITAVQLNELAGMQLGGSDL
jgi:chemotaxis protein methyltransferase CheR